MTVLCGTFFSVYLRPCTHTFLVPHRPESSDLVQAGPSVPLAIFSAPPALLVPQGPVVAFYGLARPNAAASVQLQRRLAMQRDGHLWAWIFFMEPLRGV